MKAKKILEKVKQITEPGPAACTAISEIVDVLADLALAPTGELYIRETRLRPLIRDEADRLMASGDEQGYAEKLTELAAFDNETASISEQVEALTAELERLKKIVAETENPLEEVRCDELEKDATSV